MTRKEIAELPGLKVRRNELQKQLEKLEETKSQVSAELYTQLREKYKRELDGLLHVIQERQEEIEKLVLEHVSAISVAESREKELAEQLRQLDMLWDIGAVGDIEFHREGRRIGKNKSTAQRTLKMAQAEVEWLRHCMTSEVAEEGFSNTARSVFGYSNRGKHMSYAGFWKRFAAFFIDSIITMIGATVIGLSFAITMAASGTDDPDTLDLVWNTFGCFLDWVYHSVMDSSPTQGTLGKMALGIKVTDLSGDRVGFGKATGRYFGKVISALILLVGFFMVAFTEKKQGLHDMMAGCLVVNK